MFCPEIVLILLILVLIVILVAARLNAERFNIGEILYEHNNRDVHRRV